MSKETVAGLFDVRSHNPSFFAVKESAAFEGELLDFCIPVNLHFPPAELFEMIRRDLGEILRDRLLRRHGLLVRECSNKTGSSEQYLRLAVQGRAAVDVLVPALRDELARLLARPSELAA